MAALLCCSVGCPVKTVSHFADRLHALETAVVRRVPPSLSPRALFTTNCGPLFLPVSASLILPSAPISMATSVSILSKNKL